MITITEMAEVHAARIAERDGTIATLTAEVKRLQDQLNQPPMWGENHCGAKLTDADVLAIRARYKRYDRLHGTPAIAREYGMSHSAIGAVVRGLAWKHLPLSLQLKEGE